MFLLNGLSDMYNKFDDSDQKHITPKPITLSKSSGFLGNQSKFTSYYGITDKRECCAKLVSRLYRDVNDVVQKAFTVLIRGIIIHQTHYEKSDWSRAFNQFTIACELDMINAISAADIAFIMSSSTSAWLPSPLECSQKQNG